MTYGTARDQGLGPAAHLGAHLAAATYCPAEQELRWQPKSAASVTARGPGREHSGLTSVLFFPPNIAKGGH